MRRTTIAVAAIAVGAVVLWTTAGLAADPQVKLLAGDAARTVFEVSFPAHDAVSAAPALVIPVDAQPTWRVRSATWWTDPAGAPDPAGLIRVEGPLAMRGVGLFYVGVLPQVGAAAPASVVIEVDHPAGAGQAPWLTRVDDEPAWLAEAATESAPPNLVNRAMYPRLRVAARLASTAAAKAARRVVPEWFALNDTWVRLELKDTGPYALTGEQLRAMNVSLPQIVPATLRLYRGGGDMLPEDPTVADDDLADRMGLNEVAIAVEAGTDGTFDLADRILFYGFGSDTWLDRLQPTALPLDTFEHRSCDAAVYWLTWEDAGDPTPLPGTPRRIATVAAPAHAGLEPLTQHWARLHAEENYASVPGVVQDMFAWESGIISSLAESFYLEAVVTGEPTTFVADVRGRTANRVTPTFRTRAWLNNDSVSPASLVIPEAMLDDSLRIRLRGTSTRAITGPNLLRLSYDNYNVDGAGGGNHMPMVLDSFDIRFRQSLDKARISGAVACNHWADEVAAPGMQVNLQVAVPAAQVVRVWDVSDAASVRALLPTAESGALTIGLTREPGTSAQLLVIAEDDFLTVAAGAKVAVSPLRETVGAVDYIVIAPPAFRAAAEALADLRRRVLPGVANPAVAVVTTDDIYANFSGGQKDPLAIRNFLRWNFLAYGQRLRYACLVGDASVDYRNRLDFDPATQLVDWLPTPYDTDFPRYIPNSDDGDSNPFATDDGLATFDAPQSGRQYDAPDIATGRLIVTSPASALEMVERIRRYTESPPAGLWRNRALFIADDLRTPRVDGESYHTVQADSLARSYVPASIDLEKVYGINYPLVGQYKPAARADLLNRLNAGQTIMYYVGHGSPTLLSDEQMMLGTDARALTNGERRFLFLALSCDVGMYAETTSQSMAEDMVISRDGGAIAAIAASMVSYVTSNNWLSNQYFSALYPQQHVRAEVTIGDALRAAKLALWQPDGNDFTMRNSRRYTLLGDPALRLPHPIDDLAFAADSLDTLRTGRPHLVAIDLAAQGVTAGTGVTYDLRVEESALDRRYYGVRTWREAGNTMFRGTGTAGEDPLTVPFLAPLQMRRGQMGRVRLIINDHGQERVAVARVPAVAAAAGTDDHQGPTIALALENGRYRVQPGTSLQATLTDTSGINILGSNPSSSVLLEFDGNGLYTDASDLFAFAPGSYTRGRLDMPLPADLGTGPHQVALLASDMFDNVGSDTLSFELSAAGVTDIYDATVFPNPTPGPCRLVCEVTDAMSLQWDIYTVSGRRIRSLRAEPAGAGPAILAWDGRDGEGDPIANGVYLFVLRGTAPADPGHQIRKTGQLVIMR